MTPTGRTLAMLAASLAAGVGAMLAGVALLVTAGYLVSRAAAQPPILELAVVFVGVRAFGLARPALRYAERLASHDGALRLLRRVRRWFVEACLPLAPARLADWRSGDLLARLAGDVDVLQEAFLRVLAPTIVAAVLGAIVAGVLACFDVRAALVFGAIVVIEGVVLPWMMRQTYRTREDAGRREAEHAALTADLVSLLRGLDDVAAFGQEQAQQHRLAERQVALDACDRRAAALDAVHAAMGAAVSGLGLVSVVALLALRVHAGAIDGVWAVALTLGVLGAFEAIEGLPQAWRAQARVAAAARRVFEVTDMPPVVVDPETPVTWPPFSHAPSLRLDHVTFGYGERVVLDDVSLDVAPCEHVAIVGSSGVGKSTLLDLICRFRDPQRGQIAIDGRDIRTASLADLRASLAFVPQQVHVFDATLRDNVRIGRPSASDEEVRRVLDAVRLGGLPGTRHDDLDAPMGREGRRLSVGERQRLGVARVMLTDARLVLVDEPAAHLDVETERDVLAALGAWARDRTLVVVSHRLSAVRRFDRIVVVDAGRVAGIAPHDRLLAGSRVYRDLWDAELHMLAPA